MFELSPATDEMSRLVARVTDEQLGDATPCSDWTVADLLAHVHQFADVFTHNARKEPPHPPSELVDDWRVAIPEQLAELARAWREEPAWQGRVSAGGVEMAAADNAVVAVEELTTHAWDLARATGQDLRVAPSSLDEVDRFFVMFPGASDGDGPFGPAFIPAGGLDRLDLIIARTGRDPAWSPAT